MSLKLSPKSVRSMRVAVVLFCFACLGGSRLTVGPVSHPYLVFVMNLGAASFLCKMQYTFVCKNNCIRTLRLKYEFAHSYNQELKH